MTVGRPGTTIETPPPAVLGVVVPVHDEEALLGECLTALRASAATVAGRARVVVLVVLDDCRDRSASIARRHGVGVLRVRHRSVGRARRAGCSALLGRSGPPVSWLASTDADSRVPGDWLPAHLDALHAGCDALTGTVGVDDWGDHPPSTQRWFRRLYDARRGEHPHVHGANLGVRATTYCAVGGFPPLTTGEDVALVERLEGGGFDIRRTRAVPVVTSSRPDGRAPRGFAAHLLQAPPHAQSDRVTSPPATDRATGGTRVSTSRWKSVS